MAEEEAYTTFGFRTQRKRFVLVSSVSAFSGPRMCGVMIDLEDPDREIVARRVAARHSELLGLGLGLMVWQVTDDARMLNRPTSV